MDERLIGALIRHPDVIAIALIAMAITSATHTTDCLLRISGLM